MPSAHKGAISFGLVHIPIQLQVAVREHDLSFNQLCKKTGERIRYKKFCPSCNKEIKQDEIVKGYEYEKDKYVIISGEDLEKNPDGEGQDDPDFKICQRGGSGSDLL